MDEIEFKLTSNNPVLIAHGLSRLLESIKNKIKTGSSINDLSKIPELQSLYTRCKNENTAVSFTASQALISLVENGLLEISSALSQFIVTLSETKNYLAAIAAICNLLVLELKLRNSTNEYTCPFFIKAPQHPLITVLIQKPDAWRDVLGQMQSMLHCKSEYLTNHIELLRPVFMYTLCNPLKNSSESCRQRLWHLLLNTQGTMHLQLEILQWLRANDSSSCINTSNMVLELAELTLVQKNYELSVALGPLIMALALDLLKHNSDPRSNINMIESIVNSIDGFTHDIAGNIMLALLSEILIVTPTFCLIDAMKIGKLIIEKFRYNDVIAHSLIASILPWMAYVNLLTTDALDIGKDLINTISQNSCQRNNINELCSNRHQYVNIIRHANQHYQFYIEICKYFEYAKDDDLIFWLERLSKIPIDLLLDYKLVLGGIFLHCNISNVIKITAKLLLQIAQSNKSTAGYVLSLLLYKLTSTHEIDVTKDLLIILPELAVSKENVPIIIHTLETFVKADKPLKYLAINLYLKTWLVEPRCHRHLLTALIDMNKNDKTMMGNVTCAKAMKFICENKPEHGAELVPLLSHILNCCTDTTGSAAYAMALEGISALCLSGVADTCSTWKVLSPKIYKEQRPIVIKSICEFFADIPSSPTQSEDEFDKLINEALKQLWQFTCFETTRNMEIIESSFKALSAYSLSKMSLSVLPEQYKSNLKLPDNYVKSSDAEETKIEDILTYIPGTCWICMLENIYEPARSIAGNLIIKFITDELYYLRTGIYMWPRGEPINFKYLPEKSPARAVGEYLRRHKALSTPDKQKVAVECLRIFANKYPKALPPIKWDLMNNAMKISDEAWSYGVTIACHQAIVSPSAKEFLSKYLAKIAMQISEMSEDEFKKKCWHLCLHLEDICRGVMSNALGPFLDSTVNYIVDKAIIGRENFFSMFSELMTYYSKALMDDLVHHDNKTLITDILEKLLIKVNVKHKMFSSIVEAMLQMSIEQIERITLPAVWAEITDEKLEKAIVIRAGLVLKKDNEMPLSWMNEIIRVSASMPGTHRCLLDNMVRILPHLRHEKSNATWCWDLMCRIQTIIVDSTKNHSIDSIKFLCDLLFVTVIILTCNNCQLANDESIITLHDVRTQLFPHAIARIITTPHWKDMALQIMECPINL
ncbi:hypothetical protein PV326_008454 [Microctonus aethiopoides]|nr:hypothetical protein PV326_008454 [Microctonus aethiopoides]